jgi:hypothetical protein
VSRNKQRNKELSLAIVGGRLSLFLDARAPVSVREAIAALGIFSILLPPYDKLPVPVAAHPDLLLFDLGKQLLVYRDYYQANRELFADIPVLLTDHQAGAFYPHDVGMDALSLDGIRYCQPDTTCPEILFHSEVQSVKQGYAACSALKVSENAIVTADDGIAAAAEKRGVAVLKIRAGHIVLRGYDYGFIGGTAFRRDDTLYFAGDLFCHPDGEAIARFCGENGVKVQSLVENSPLYDLGFLKYNKSG